MKKPFLYPADNATQSFGELQINVTTTTVGFRPIEGAKVSVTSAETNEQVAELTTDISGQTLSIEVPAPDVQYSLDPDSTVRPYSDYNVTVEAEGFETVDIEGTQILAESQAIQDAGMMPTIELSTQQEEIVMISPHTLWGVYPAKIAEPPVKEDIETGFIKLPEPVVPSIIVVHDGVPDDKTAPNYFVGFKDYIKNVASSEIYSTWPTNTIEANVLAILSFTMNRIYTEWYRGKGYGFQITSSTAFDQKFMYGRNIYKNISEVVDYLFINYISIPGVSQPILTQYCDGNRVNCPRWLSQWGSKALGDQGYTTIEILKNYYGDEIYLNTAKKVSGIPESFPGKNLQQGSRGEAVRTIQEQLNGISDNYPAIPKIRVDGVFGPQTVAAVKKFQQVFGLPANGIVDYPTWYKISDIYVAVKRLAELPF